MIANTLQNDFARLLEGTQRVTLKSLAEAAVEARDALSALCAAHMPLPEENELGAAEEHAWTTRKALLDFLLFEHGIGAALAGKLGSVL